MRALRHVGIFAACTLALTSASWNATAQGKSKAAASRLDPAKLKAELESRDESRMLAALKHVADAGDAGKPVTPHVEALVRRGASVEVLTLALNVLAGLKQPSSSAAIAPYYRHRVPEVRLAATKALLQTGGPAGIKALRAALRSPDARVRGMAASGLGSLNASEALPDLFAALNHNVGEAATSIGQLCKPVECEKLAGYLGKLPFDVVTSGFDQILFRPEKEMPEEQKIRIVGRLRELGTKDAGNYLADVAERWPKDWSKRVKQAIDAAVKALGGSSSSAEDD
ncbi:MAG: HEAT repeat domain-containing protein [Polyangiaceae bacterium]